MLKQISQNKYFYLLVLFLGLTVLLMHPFLRYPFDIYAHLIAIDEFYHGANTTTTTIQHGRLIWHALWADVFTLLHIDSNQIFLRAKIIFTLQTFFNFFAVYYFSKVVIRNLFYKHDNNIHSVALWSTFIWFTIFATISAQHHLVWTFWYSVNYQITLGMFWYITALTLVLILEDISLKKYIFFTLQIIVISLFILRVHSMEFMYYLMFMTMLILVYLDKTFLFIKKYYYFIIPLMAIIFLILKTLLVESSKIFNYLTLEKLPLLYHAILENGTFIVVHLNRSSTSINELMYIIAFITLFMIINMSRTFFLNHKYFNFRVFVFMILTSLFVIIPIYEFSSGLFSMIARKDVIHRLYYSSSIFILLPISVYYFVYTLHLKKVYIHIILFTVLLATAMYSKYSTFASHNYYKNIRSIEESFDKDKYSFHLNQQQIDLIGQKIKNYEKNNQTQKETYFYARADIAFVIKYIYHKKVFWKGRRANPNFIKAYENRKNNAYQNILFETPKNFPKYIPFW